jgi:hypothetical protein
MTRCAIQARRPATPRCRKPLLEQLEDRSIPSAYTAASVSDLIADIHDANHHGGLNTITLVPGTTFELTAVDNTHDGATGLPVIKSGSNLTIVGNGDLIDRSTASGTPAFRLLDVASGAALTLQGLTLQNGLAFGAGVEAEGGAIFNQGTLDLNGVTVQANLAQGSMGKVSTALRFTGEPGQDAAGGGIWSGGTLTLENGTKVQNNEALGGRGGRGLASGGPGGNGLGGGVYVAGGTFSLTSAAVSNNTASGGGAGSGASTGPGPGGGGAGGGLYVAGGTVTLSADTVASNTAKVGYGIGTAASHGGGLYIAAGATVYLDSFTLTNTINNIAAVDPNIDGSYTLLN